jgi:formylglycine-generating enzyme required for sulfatase activity
LSGVLFTSCYETDPLVLGGKPYLYHIQNNETYWTDTLTLFGENLGVKRDSSYIVINDTLHISSNNCITWTQSKIEFIVPKLPLNSTIYVVFNGKKLIVENDSTNYYQNIIVNPFPPFSTILVSAGNFMMGSNEFGIVNEMPVHNVILTKSIYVSTCEVNQRLYELIMDENPSEIKGNNYPIYNVKWLDAIQFCNFLSDESGLQRVYTIIDSPNYVSFDTTANGWRLPTEAEWEYFALDSNANITFPNADAQLKKYAWYSSNSSLNPHYTGLLIPSSLGLYDILGNVWEWCWDYYNENYYSISPIVNPQGPNQGTQHIMRGGSCEDNKLIVRFQCRKSDKPTQKVGFRLVRNQ